MGGIEVNTRDVIRGLRRRGHEVLINKEFPGKATPDVVASSTFGPWVMWKIRKLKHKYNAAVVQHALTTVEDLKGGGFIPEVFHRGIPLYIKLLYGAAHLLITPTPYSKRLLDNLDMQKPVHAMSCGISFKKFHPDPEKGTKFREEMHAQYGIPLDKPLILNVGVTWERKGVDAFYRVARALPEYAFVWVGPVMKNADVDLARALPNVTFAGYYADVQAAYCGADLFFFPSYEENLGIPLVEAAAVRLPIVARNLEPFHWLAHEQSALFGSTDQEFVAQIKSLLTDPARARTLTEGARRVALACHDLDTIGDRVEALYRRAIQLKDLAFQRFGRI